MARFDKELSRIDTCGYVQALPPAAMPALLDVRKGQCCYRFGLLAAHMWEKQKASRVARVEHAHDVYHIVLYVAGEGCFRLQGAEHRARPGSLVLVGPGQSHSFRTARGSVAYHAVTFALTAASDALRVPFAELLAYYSGSAVTLPAVQELLGEDCAVARRCMEGVVKRAMAMPVDWFGVTRELIELCGWLCGNGAARAENIPGAALAQRAEALITERFADPELSLASLARTLHTAPEHLCREFHDALGLPPMTFRNQLRMRAATNLLRNSNLPCKAIAGRLGYSDLYAFSKAYRRMTGRPPSAER